MGNHHQLVDFNILYTTRVRQGQADKPLAPMTRMRRPKRVFAIDIETRPKCGANRASSPASKIPMSSPRSSSTFVLARQPQPSMREHLRTTQSSPPRDTRTGSRRNARLTPCCDRYPSNRRFARPFRLQRPPPHPQRAQRTPLKTSPERPVNQPYFATIPFRAVIRPIRAYGLAFEYRDFCRCHLADDAFHCCIPRARWRTLPIMGKAIT